jgi:hypothetical protein
MWKEGGVGNVKYMKKGQPKMKWVALSVFILAKN